MGDALLHLSNRTKLEWQANLNTEYTPKRNHRRTSIIGTIGMLGGSEHVADSANTKQDVQAQRPILLRRSLCSEKVFCPPRPVNASPTLTL